jgi:hypothetical protein
MSNLIALKDNNNDIGLGTSLINLGTTSGTSILPFKKNDDTILLDFNTIDNSIHLGTITSGTWQGNSIDTTYGGTGLASIGNAEEVLAVKNNTGDLEWINLSNNETSESIINISTNSNNSIGIGSMNHKVTINASTLNINIGSTTPSNNNILQYNGSSLQWQTSSTTSLNKLFSLINTFHPGYILLLKSLDVKVNSVSQTLVPSFDIGTTSYSVGIGSNYTVNILPTLFSSIPITKINSSTINIPNTNTNNLLNHTSPNTFSITNSHNTSSRTYTLNITRTILHDADLKAITISTNPTITFNSFSSSTTSYNIDVLSNLTSFIITTQVHNTASYISISNKNNNNGTNGTNLNINSTTGNVDASGNLESIIPNKTITPIYIFIKAEDTSIDKEYIFNVSRPPRSTNDIEKIELLDDNDNLIVSAITPFATETNLETANSDDIFKFRITKKHHKQVVNINKILDDNSSQLVETLDSFEIVTSININNKSQSDVTSGGSDGASQTYRLVITPPDNSLSKKNINVNIKRPSSNDASLSFIGVDSNATNDNTISTFSGSNNSFTNSTEININDNSVDIHFKAPTGIFGQSVKVGLNDNYNNAIELKNNTIYNDTVTGLLNGDNTINIHVTSQDTNVFTVYTFTKIHVLQSGNLLKSIETREVSTEKYETVNSFSSSGGTFTLEHGSINDTLEIQCTRETASNQAEVSFAIDNPRSLDPVPTSSVINANIRHRFSDLSGSTKLIEKTTYTVKITVTSETGVDKTYSLTVVQKNTISTLSELSITDHANISSTKTSASLSLGTTTQSNLYITPTASSTPVTIKYSTNNSYGDDTTMTSENKTTLSLSTGINNIYIYVVPEVGTVPASGTIPNGDIDTGDTDNSTITYISIYYRTITKESNPWTETFDLTGSDIPSNNIWNVRLENTTLSLYMNAYHFVNANAQNGGDEFTFDESYQTNAHTSFEIRYDTNVSTWRLVHTGTPSSGSRSNNDEDGYFTNYIYPIGYDIQDQGGIRKKIYFTPVNRSEKKFKISFYDNNNILYYLATALLPPGFPARNLTASSNSADAITFKLIPIL